MEIIKFGRVTAERKWRGTCSSCEAEIVALESELTNIQEDQDGKRYVWEKCPACGTGPENGVCLYPESDVCP